MGNLKKVAHPKPNNSNYGKQKRFATHKSIYSQPKEESNLHPSHSIWTLVCSILLSYWGGEWVLQQPLLIPLGCGIVH